MKSEFLALFLLLAVAHAHGGALDSIPNQINEARFITINGIEQWVTIKGDRTKPVVLFLHGGPGSPLSPFADAIYAGWEKDFVLVQWDQRGAGRTYGRNAPRELTAEYLRSTPLSIAQMTSDGIELVQYLLQYLGKEKVILFGTSWGSVLGVKMSFAKPELLYAFIAHSQVVNPSATSLAAYEKVYGLAKIANDQNSIELLDSIGRPPYEAARTAGLFNRLLRKYQQQRSTPAPPEWFELPPAYDNEVDNQNRSVGDDYSFVNFVGDRRLGVTPMSATIDFMNNGLSFDIPVYFIQGENDIATPEATTRAYYNRLTAPAKKLVVIPNADHAFNKSVVDAHYQIMMEHVVPSIRN